MLMEEIIKYIQNTLQQKFKLQKTIFEILMKKYCLYQKNKNMEKDKYISINKTI